MELPVPHELQPWVALGLAFAFGFLLLQALLGAAAPVTLGYVMQKEAAFEEALKDLFVRDVTARRLVQVKFIGPFVVAGLVYLVTGKPVFAVALAAGTFLAPDAWLARVRFRRRERLEVQAVDVINAIATTTKAGLTLRESLDEAAGKLPAPASEELGIVCERLRTGQALDAALMAAEKRLAIPGYTLLIRALIVNRERGGRLADLLERASDTLRELAKLDEKVKSQTSGIRLAARIMVCMPVVLGGILYMMDPSSINVLFDSFLGNVILVVIGVMDIVGFLMLQKLANPDI
jgi:tight adherence protein B